MAHNQEMLTKNGSEWGDNVRIIGIAIDNDCQAVAKHVDQKGWEKIEHYWNSTSDCICEYMVKGVPHVMLLDKDGNIVFKGHPTSRPDLATDINTLLNGEKLVGEGTKAHAQLTDGNQVLEGFAEVDSDAINKEMDEFRVTCEHMQKELHDTAKGMIRNYCVSVFTQRLDTTSMKWLGKYENFRVLVGSQSKIDECNEIINKQVKGSFKIQE